MKRFTGCALAIALLLWQGPAAGQSSMSEVQINTQHVGGSVYMLEGRGGNVGASVGEDGILVIDDQFAPMAPRIREALRELSRDPVVYLLNTHHHGDHTGGNAAFAKEATIVAQTNVRTRLSQSRNHDPKSLPIVTFDNSVSVHFNGEEIRMVHFPHGHTDNDCVIFFPKSNVVHMGDLLFTGSYPSFYTNEGGDIEGYARNVGEILKLLAPDTRIIPGHGALASVDDVREFHAMLVETIDIVQKQIDAGKSLEDVQAAGLPEKYDRWSSSFTSNAQWVAKVYRSLTD